MSDSASIACPRVLLSLFPILLLLIVAFHEPSKPAITGNLLLPTLLSLSQQQQQQEAEQEQQEPSPHEVAIVETAGLTSATGDEDARAGDRGAASSSQGVPTASTNDVPAAQSTKPKEPAWDKEMARFAYVACRTLVAYAWVSRYHPSGTSKLTGWWVMWCLQLTGSRDFNGFLAAYAWPVGRLLVALVWGVAVVLWNVINSVFLTTMAGSAVLGYVCFKIWLADNRLESDRYGTISNGTF